MDQGYSIDIKSPQSDQGDQNLHDVQASLAIANGFSSALQSAHNELLQFYNESVNSIANGATDIELDQMRQLEQDCKFCLSRLVQCVEQLKKRLEDANSDSDSENNNDSDCMS